MTEKVFQAYIVGAIPLYYSGQVQLVLLKKSVIYVRDFIFEDGMIEYIKKVDNDDELYYQIWNQKIITYLVRNYEDYKGRVKK